MVRDEPSEKWSSSPSPSHTWKHQSSPSSRLKRVAPSPTSEKSSYSQPSSRPKPSPSPSPSWHPSPPSPTQQSCNYRCPLKDLAKSPLMDEAIRVSSLYCGYSSSDCKTCSLCKYSVVCIILELISYYAKGRFQKTGLLLEDNDDGNCPQTASSARPWDRRVV